MDDIDIASYGSESGVTGQAAVGQVEFDYPAVSGIAPTPEITQTQHQPQPSMSDQEYNWRAVREELRNLRDENQKLNWQMQQNAVAKEPDIFQGKESDDFISVNEFKNYVSRMQREFEDRLSQVSVKASYHDWDGVVREHAAEAIKEYPQLQGIIQNSPNPYEAAYLFGKFYRDARTQSSGRATAQRVIQNAQQPRPVHSVGGNAERVNQADIFSTMSDDDFQAYANKMMETL